MEYKIVIIDTFVESIDTPITKKFLHKIISARKEGFNARHNQRYLPFSVEDFISQHALICRVENNDLEVLSTSKIIPSEICDFYSIEHPMLRMMGDHFHKDFRKFVEETINSLHDNGKKTSYSGSFSINKKKVRSKEEVNLLKEIYCMIHACLHKDRNIDVALGFTAPKMKTDELFKQWGMSPILFNDEPQVKFLPSTNQEVIPTLCDMENLTPYSREMINKYSNLWESRIDNKINKFNKEKVFDLRI